MAVKRVLRYLKGTVDYDLYYAPFIVDIHVFCDSDWAGNPDDRRSTSGFSIFLGNNLISWYAKKQGVVSRSSTEAEYRSMALATAEAYWIRMLIKEFQLYLYSPPIIWCDNIGALILASNPVFHARTKQVEIDYHFMREKVVNKDILVKHISTKDQLANIFTKGQTTTRFQFLRSKLMVRQLPISLQKGVRVCNDSVKSLLRESREKLKKLDQDNNYATNKSPPDFSHSLILYNWLHVILKYVE
jgi:hypothetical protein